MLKISEKTRLESSDDVTVAKVMKDFGYSQHIRWEATVFITFYPMICKYCLLVEWVLYISLILPASFLLYFKTLFKIRLQMRLFLNCYNFSFSSSPYPLLFKILIAVKWRARCWFASAVSLYFILALTFLSTCGSVIKIRPDVFLPYLPVMVLIDKKLEDHF